MKDDIGPQPHLAPPPWDQIEKLKAEIERLRVLLNEVRDATAMPLPDPGAHSWRAFYDTACTQLTRCAAAARRANP